MLRTAGTGVRSYEFEVVASYNFYRVDIKRNRGGIVRDRTGKKNIRVVFDDMYIGSRKIRCISYTDETTR